MLCARNIRALFLLTLGFCLATCAATADTFFTSLGPSGGVYDPVAGFAVSGADSNVGRSFTIAHGFTASMGGSVNQIDLGVGYVTGEREFYASIWTNTNGLPGTQIAYWDNLTSSANVGGCCGLVTVGGISGVDLETGESYFMVLGSTDVTDTSFNVWARNTQGVTGAALFSGDGGSNWRLLPGSTLIGAFDILGEPVSEPPSLLQSRVSMRVVAPVPEPGSLLLLGTGLAALALGASRRRK